MSSDLPLSLQESYELLAAASRALMEAGKRTYPAGLKPEMQRRSAHRFSEQALGFTTFREFIEDAESAGVVSLQVDRWGQIAIAPSDSSRPPASPGRVHIREDLWTAFVDWREGLLRVYHRPPDRAYVLSESPEPWEPEESKAIRRQWAEDPDAFVRIDPIDRDTHLEWMTGFAETVEDPVARAALIAALGTDRPAGAFSTVLRGLPRVQAAWKTARVRRVAARIQDWIDRNELPIEVTGPDGAPVRQASPGSHGTPSEFEARVRADLRLALDRMSLEELLALRVPVGALIGR